MKSLFTFFSLFVVLNSYAQTGIGTTTPESSAKLDVSSTNKGFLPPRMTATQRGNIPSPAAGLMVYQTDAPIGFYYYNGIGWLNISNLGTTNRYIPYSSQFAQYSSGQSLTTVSIGTYINLTGSDLEVIVPSGFTSNKVVINWDTWGDVSTTNASNGSFRYQIDQSGTSSNSFGSIAMNGWATTTTSPMRFATPVTYIITDLAPGTYTFKLQIAREGENGTINTMNNYYVAGSAQIFVK